MNSSASARRQFRRSMAGVAVLGAALWLAACAGPSGSRAGDVGRGAAPIESATRPSDPERAERIDLSERGERAALSVDRADKADRLADRADQSSAGATASASTGADATLRANDEPPSRAAQPSVQPNSQSANAPATPARVPSRDSAGDAGASVSATQLTEAGAQALRETDPSAGGPPLIGRRGGGYYDNDGPPDRVPPNLDRTPDAVPRAEAPVVRTNRPYMVFGKNYVPVNDARGWRERGMASWYGRKFHGQRTSSGETYNMFAMTAAHPTLPIPSYVRVTNSANRKSVVVRINDRGPFLQNRVIDLSYVAAYKLGYLESGSTAVELEVLDAAEQTLALKTGDQKPVEAPPASAPRIINIEPPAPVSEGGRAPVIALTTPPSQALLVPERLIVEAAATPSDEVRVTAPEDAKSAGSAKPATEVRTPPAEAKPLPPAAKLDDVKPAAPEPKGSVEPAAKPAGEVKAALTEPSRAPAAASIVALAPPSTVAPSADAASKSAGQASSVFLQLAAFSSRENADQASTRLRSMLDWMREPIRVVAHGDIFRLHAGPFVDRRAALAAAEKIRAATDVRPFTVAR